MTDISKRRQISLSLSLDEGDALNRAAQATGHTPTSLATALYRYAFRRYEEIGSIEQLLREPSGESQKKRRAG